MLRRRKKYILWACLAILICLFAFRLQSKIFHSEPTVSVAATPVEVQKAKIGFISNTLLLTGNIEPEQTVVLSSKRGNRVTGIYAEENQAIKQGQLLVQLDSQDLNAQLAQNRAQTAASQANADQVKAQLDNAYTDLHRAQNLFTQGAISQQQLDIAKTQYNALAAQYRATKAQTQATNSGSSYVNTLIMDNLLKAPFNGIVISKQVEEGEVVDSGKPILTVAKVDKMKVKANVSEMDVSKIKVGQEVKVLVDALSGEKFMGKVKQILPQVDLQSRALVVEITIANPQFKIKPNMFARAYIDTAQHENAVIIPKEAVIYREDKPFVFLAIANKAKLVPVTLGIIDKNLVEITQGVKADDKVVTLGQNVINDNSLLEIRKVGE